MRESFYLHIAQGVSHQDRFVTGGIVLVQVTLTRLEMFWSLATKSHSERPQSLYIVPFVDCLAIEDRVDINIVLAVVEWHHHEIPSRQLFLVFLGLDVSLCFLCSYCLFTGYQRLEDT